MGGKAVMLILSPCRALLRQLDSLGLNLLAGRCLCAASCGIVVEDPATEHRGQQYRQDALALFVAPSAPEPEGQGKTKAEPLARGTGRTGWDNG